MKIQLHHIFFILCFTILTPGGILSSQAQDASYPIPDSFDMELERERDRGVYSAGEFDPLLNNKNQVIRDSIMARPTYNRSSRSQLVESANAAKTTASDAASILSFTFLYSLVEKYKMQDIVD